MCQNEIIQIPRPDNFDLIDPGLKVWPELVFTRLADLQQQLISGALEPTAYLDRQELATYRQFKYIKRQIEWLGGRLAAKKAVLRLEGQETSSSAMRQWVLLTDKHGKPFFENTEPNRFDLSISHSHDLALAMATKKGRCGLDIQKISPATIRVKEKFCSQSEQQIITRLTLPVADPAGGLTLLWAAKEALRKARGGHPLTGFTAMQLTEVLPSADQCRLFTIMVGNERYQLPTFFHDDYAIAWCIIPPPPLS